MVIMNPYGGRSLLQFVQHRIGEASVKRLVPGPERFAIGNPIERHVTERPQHLIGVALTAIPDHYGFERNSLQSIGRRIGRHRETVALAGNFMVRGSASPRNPGSAEKPHDRV